MLGEAELALLRQIGDAVRRGHVRRRHPPHRPATPVVDPRP
jgi:hypothetical protein